MKSCNRKRIYKWQNQADMALHGTLSLTRHGSPSTKGFYEYKKYTWAAIILTFHSSSLKLSTLHDLAPTISLNHRLILQVGAATPVAIG